MGEVGEPRWRRGVGLGNCERSSLQEGKEKDRRLHVMVDFPSGIAKPKTVAILLVSSLPYYCEESGPDAGFDHLVTVLLGRT